MLKRNVVKRDLVWSLTAITFISYHLQITSKSTNRSCSQLRFVLLRRHILVVCLDSILARDSQVTRQHRGDLRALRERGRGGKVTADAVEDAVLRRPEQRAPRVLAHSVRVVEAQRAADRGSAREAVEHRRKLLARNGSGGIRAVGNAVGPRPLGALRDCR